MKNIFTWCSCVIWRFLYHANSGSGLQVKNLKIFQHSLDKFQHVLRCWIHVGMLYISRNFDSIQTWTAWVPSTGQHIKSHHCSRRLWGCIWKCFDEDTWSERTINTCSCLINITRFIFIHFDILINWTLFLPLLGFGKFSKLLGVKKVSVNQKYR